MLKQDRALASAALRRRYPPEMEPFADIRGSPELISRPPGFVQGTSPDYRGPNLKTPIGGKAEMN